jgi:4-amino-4-deoxy-L-arabinose transferase-like glycosyltransferase
MPHTAGWGTAALVSAMIAGALIAAAATTTLWDRDEPRFAQATVEMVRSGNYLYPTFNGELRPDKPILIYWLMSVPVRWFGAREVAVRSIAALGMALAALATYAAGRWLFAPRTGLLAALILVTTPLALVEGSAATTDAVLLACITIALAGFAHAFRFGWRLAHTVVLAVSLSAGLYTKGPVGLLVPLASMALAWWLGRHHTPLRPRDAGALALSATLAVAVFLVWAIPADTATAGGLGRGGLGHHVVQRMLEPLEGHGGRLLLSLPYYVIVAFVGFFPWTVYLAGALAALSGGRLGGAAPRAVLVGWIVPTFVTMTLVATKLPHYVLPIWPALALAAAATIAAAEQGALAERDRRWWRRGAWLGGAAALVWIAALVALPWWLPAPGLRAPAVAAASIVLATTVATIRALHRGRPRSGAVAAIVGVVCCDAVMAVGVLPALDRLKVAPPIATAIAATQPAGAPVVTRGFGEPSLVFYLPDRPVRALASDADVARWASDSGAGTLVVPRAALARIEARHGALGLSEIAAARGYNFGRGEWLELVALVRTPAPATLR